MVGGLKTKKKKKVEKLIPRSGGNNKSNANFDQKAINHIMKRTHKKASLTWLEMLLVDELIPW